MLSVLKYTDEEDRSYGVAGMTISLLACDAENMLSCVSLEPEEDSVEMSEEFFFNGNPRQSARIAWNELLRQLRVAAAMGLGNVICRARTRGRRPAEDMLRAIHDFVAEQGQAECSLEADEIEKLYRHDLGYYDRLFSHPGVQDVAREFATVLRMRRRMSAGEVFEQLSRFNHL